MARGLRGFAGLASPTMAGRGGPTVRSCATPAAGVWNVDFIGAGTITAVATGPAGMWVAGLLRRKSGSVAALLHLDRDTWRSFCLPDSVASVTAVRVSESGQVWASGTGKDHAPMVMRRVEQRFVEGHADLGADTSESCLDQISLDRWENSRSADPDVREVLETVVSNEFFTIVHGNCFGSEGDGEPLGSTLYRVLDDTLVPLALPSSPNVAVITAVALGPGPSLMIGGTGPAGAFVAWRDLER